MAEYGRPAKDSGIHHTVIMAGAIAATGLFALSRKAAWTERLEKSLSSDIDRIYEDSAASVDQKSKLVKTLGERTGKTQAEAADFARESILAGSDLYQATHKLQSVDKFREFMRNGQGIGDISGMYALRLEAARSAPMRGLQWASQYVKPLQLLDDLGGLRLLREAYGYDSAGAGRKAINQIQYLGRAHELSIWQQNFPEDIDRNASAFFAHGRLFVEDGDTFKQIQGQYSMFGRASAGEHRSVMEHVTDDLSGRAIDPVHLFHIMYGKDWNGEIGEEGGMWGRIRSLESQARSPHITKAQAKKYRREAAAKRRQVNSMYAQASSYMRRFVHDEAADDMRAKASFATKIRDRLDLGYNMRAAPMWTSKYWHEQFENLGNMFNPPEELSAERHPESYDIIPAFHFNRKDITNVFLGGEFRGKRREFNSGTVLLHHLFKRVNDQVASNSIAGWFALSSGSAQSPASLISNIILKRGLPFYGAMFYAGYLNDEIGQRTGERPSDRLTHHSANAQLHWAHYKDEHGISEWARHVDKLSGGALGYIAHPFVDHQVGLSERELRDYYAHGSDPIRKGRWWSFGSSTPFRGERIMYYNPNASRYADAGDIYKTDTLWGSFDEYYKNAALPTFEHPLAPIRHFITDRYHWDERHYRDRPYLASGPMFEPTSLHGVLLNPTVGRILKPTRYYHEDELPYIVHGRHAGERNPRFHGEVRSMNEQIKDRAASREVTGFVTPSGTIQPMQAVGLPGSDRRIAPINDEQGDAIAQEANDAQELRDQASGVRGMNANAATRTPGHDGKHRVRAATRAANEETKGRGASRFTQGRMLEPIAPPGLFGNLDPNDSRVRRRLTSPDDPRYQFGLGYYSLTEIGGIYGFGAVSATGDVYADRPMLADSSRMTSFERTYWDRWNTGGMLPTPGLSEIFRRFMPHRYHSNSEYDPVRNRMASWLPGMDGEDPAYFMDFLHGDPYTKVPNGEARLPGTAYERLHGIGKADLSLRLSQVGYDPEFLHGFLTGRHAPFAAWNDEIAERGADQQQRVLRSLQAQGRLVESNVSFRDTNQVQGTIDAVVQDDTGRSVLDIHSVSHRGFGSLQAGEKGHAEQLNYEMHALGLQQGELVYVDRETGEKKTFTQNYNAELYQATMAKISRVRNRIQQEIKAGQYQTGELYSDLTKFQILGDVAPWSSQYKYYRDYLTHFPEGELSPDDRALLQEVKHQVSTRKKRFNMTPYQLRYGNVVDERVTVKDIIDANTFTTFEHPNNPIRMAGVRLRSDDDAKAWLAQHIHHGAQVRIQIAEDPTQRVSRDSLHTIRAAVYDSSGQLNRAAIDQGYGTETEEHGPAALRVHYNDRELRQARVFEWIGHAKIPFFHNKFMPIDSPLELYKRTQVFGKDWQDWKHPFKDYLYPSFESFAQQGLPGLFGAAVLGYGLGVGSFKRRLPIALISMGIAETIHLARSDERVPHYRVEERGIDAYFDILKYIKYEGLYEKSREWIKTHQHHDIGLLADRYQRDGEQRKRRIQVLKNEKRQIIVSGQAEHKKARIAEINAELRELQGYRKQLDLTREDVMALQYRQMAQTTLYGSDTHGNLSQVMLAMDPKEREFFQAFLKAAGPERAEILRIVPENERRFLQAAWGMQPDAKPELSEYFKTHNLPSANWSGWRADSNLDDYKLVVMKDEGINLTSHGFWPQDEERVKELGLWDVQPRRGTGGDIKTQLHSVLAGYGLRDVDINLIPNGSGRHHMRMHVTQDQQDQTSGTRAA